MFIKKEDICGSLFAQNQWFHSTLSINIHHHKAHISNQAAAMDWCKVSLTAIFMLHEDLAAHHYEPESIQIVNNVYVSLTV